MGRNEIRLRRNRISSGRIAQHRNYGDIMARHEREQKIKRIARVFTYFIIILAIILLFYAVRIWERRQSMPKEDTAPVEQAYKTPQLDDMKVDFRKCKPFAGEKLEKHNSADFG